MATNLSVYLDTFRRLSRTSVHGSPVDKRKESEVKNKWLQANLVDIYSTIDKEIEIADQLYTVQVSPPETDPSPASNEDHLPKEVKVSTDHKVDSKTEMVTIVKTDEFRPKGHLLQQQKKKTIQPKPDKNTKTGVNEEKQTLATPVSNSKGCSRYNFRPRCRDKKGPENSLDVIENGGDITSDTNSELDTENNLIQYKIVTPVTSERRTRLVMILRAQIPNQLKAQNSKAISSSLSNKNGQQEDISSLGAISEVHETLLKPSTKMDTFDVHPKKEKSINKLHKTKKKRKTSSEKEKKDVIKSQEYKVNGKNEKNIVVTSLNKCVNGLHTATEEAGELSVVHNRTKDANLGKNSKGKTVEFVCLSGDKKNHKQEMKESSSMQLLVPSNVQLATSLKAESKTISQKRKREVSKLNLGENIIQNKKLKQSLGKSICEKEYLVEKSDESKGDRKGIDLQEALTELKHKKAKIEQDMSKLKENHKHPLLPVLPVRKNSSITIQIVRATKRNPCGQVNDSTAIENKSKNHKKSGKKRKLEIESSPKSKKLHISSSQSKVKQKQTKTNILSKGKTDLENQNVGSGAFEVQQTPVVALTDHGPMMTECMDSVVQPADLLPPKQIPQSFTPKRRVRQMPRKLLVDDDASKKFEDGSDCLVISPTKFPLIILDSNMFSDIQQKQIDSSGMRTKQKPFKRERSKIVSYDESVSQLKPMTSSVKHTKKIKDGHSHVKKWKLNNTTRLDNAETMGKATSKDVALVCSDYKTKSINKFYSSSGDIGTSSTTQKTPQFDSNQWSSQPDTVSNFNYEITPQPLESFYNAPTPGIPTEKPIPLWARGINLKMALIKQAVNPPDVERLFGRLTWDLDLEGIFGSVPSKARSRTSSSNWNDSSVLATSPHEEIPVISPDT